ncbi:conjugal transfer fertility inhibition protein FinO [Salmonella enterica subsp. salamae]|uniref:Conjugal transfer fertility inhibition protein FinO n=2 Tax=Salmonella enterica TaxID=28901 RepID=A0A379SFP2_SALER|nr:conjugal transfer fertility inhibition protein FinO [Salmonella enterica]SUJ08570.1 conjugal transfer fertility inhibition protein FinO [Salmonella enterica subsp. salamae]
MNDDKTRPRLSLKRKAPSADTSVPANEAGADITVSRRKTVVVNTGPKRNKKPLADDRPPAPRMLQPGNGHPKKTKKKKQPAAPTKKAVEVIPPSPKKQPRPGRSPRLMRPADAVQTLSTHWPGLFAGGQLRPLTIGVREQLFADAERRALPLSKKVIRRCLKTLTRTETYLSSLMAGVACYNADGSVESLIPPERERAAMAKLARVQTDKTKKQAAKAPAIDEKKEH